MHDGSLATPVTARFNRKRDAIVAAATEILNRRGVRGMTLALVAERLGRAPQPRQNVIFSNKQ